MMSLLYPTNPKQISSKFGFRLKPKVGWHSGIDLAVIMGTAVHPCYKGQVIFTGLRGNYGLTVILYHPSLGNVWSLYAHLSRIIVKKFDLLMPNDLVGFSGNTGYSTGPHLHFEVRVGVNGILFARNPIQYLPT